MGHHRPHGRLAEAPAAVGFQDIDLTEIGEGGKIGYHAGESDLASVTGIDSEAERIGDRTGNNLAGYSPGPVAAAEEGVDGIHVEAGAVIGDDVTPLMDFVRRHQNPGVGLMSQLRESGGKRRLILRLEKRGPGHERVGAGGPALGGGGGIDAAIDLQPKIQFTRVSPG